MCIQVLHMVLSEHPDTRRRLVLERIVLRGISKPDRCNSCCL